MPDAPGLGADPAGGAWPQASVIVVSRHRPRHLARCLRALAQQSYPHLEIVVVADPGAIDVRPDLAIKRVVFDVPNISAARNAGLAQAAGQVVLFIDDDALAEPGWVRGLCAPFVDARVIAATGFTRGPDGLSWQVCAERITPSGQPIAIEVAATALLAPEGGNPVSTLGTNCAFRRSALIAIGGFDPAFAYFLDESDVNMRLAARFGDALTAVVPAAEVVHGAAAGASRGDAGVPSDLGHIGRSSAIFAARHGGCVTGLRARQRARLLRHMQAGRLDPYRIGALLRTLDAGLASGAVLAAQGVAAPIWHEADPPPFVPLPMGHAAPLFLAGWHWRARHLRARAARAVAQGRDVTLLLLTPSFMPHRRIITDGGWWEQRGGVWGPSRPVDRAAMLMSFGTRILRERGFFAGRHAKDGNVSPVAFDL